MPPLMRNSLIVVAAGFVATLSLVVVDIVWARSLILPLAGMLVMTVGVWMFAISTAIDVFGRRK